MQDDWLAQYGLAALIGLSWVLYVLPWAVLAGTGGMFAVPGGDLPTNLAGHIAFQAPGWHWPLLRAPALAWPDGVSIAMTDSNPAVSLLAKPLAGALGHTVNLFGVWLAGCFILQPIAAVYALRAFTALQPAPGRLNAWLAAAAAAGLALLLPAYLFRIVHINLMGQFLLLAALGLAARPLATEAPPRSGAMFALLLLAVLVHPYLYLFCAATLSAPLVGMMLRRAEGTRAEARRFGLAVVLPVGLFVLLNGGLGQGGPGFGLYSMNLLSPVLPQKSGLFGADLPILDATGYQYEGFNYLGAGILLLLAAAAACLLWIGSASRRTIRRRWAGLILVLLGLSGLAVTPHVTLGALDLIPLQSRLLEQIFGVVRASGRAVWVVDDAGVVAAVGLLATRLRPALLAPLLAAGLVLQWVDDAPLRAGLRRYLAGTDAVPAAFAVPAPFTIPPGTTLFRVVPRCGAGAVAATAYQLIALRAGARLTDMRLVHPPTDAVCARALEAGLDAPLIAGETRLFLPSVRDRLRPDRLGAGVVCADVAVGRTCHKPGA